MNKNAKESMETGLEIAVIGMAARFPAARDLYEFWDNLKNGVESISFFNSDELEEAGVPPRLPRNPNYVQTSGSILKDWEYFDALFFDYTPKEALLMNPQTRIFHQCAWEALEDAGYTSESYDGLIGLYAGSSSSLLWEGKSLLSGKSNELGDFETEHLSSKDYLSTKVSYNLNLRGPSLMIYTTCSTSLAAIHLASQELLSGQCDMALAGGVSLTDDSAKGYFYQEGMITSPDGHCRAFDARAKGAIRGEGVGIVVLKPLEDATAAGDHIYAVIKGSAINNDGKEKVGYTAPSINGQAGVIKSSHRAAEIEPESIGYVETHGTATALGDPIEFEALVRAFNTNKKGFCGIGSIKTNIGHLDTAAGVAGFIKTVLILKHKQLPPSLHFETPNPKIDFQNSPFYVVTKLSAWKNDKDPLRAGVSSFGIGGTNVHVILEEAPEGTRRHAPLPIEQPSREYQLIVLSAKTQSALDKMTINLAEYLKRDPGINLADAAYTLQVGRKHFNHRRMMVCPNTGSAGAVKQLSARHPHQLPTSFAKEENRPVVFIFPGIGAQYVNMGLGLYQKESIFREEMDRCFAILEPLMGYDIKEVLYPDPLVSKVSEASGANIDQFEVAQVVIFIFEYALAKLITRWGLKPWAMIGYSLGEYAAACISGVFSLEDALKLVVSRGQLIGKTSAGAMISVPLSQEQITPFLKDQLSLAIDNGPSCIAAGSCQAVAALEQEMKKKKLLCMRVKTSRALHSSLMAPILTVFKNSVCQITLNEPQIPYISNLTGDWQTPQQATNPDYWSSHLRKTVRFAQGMKELIKEENAVFIELGPGRDLCALLARYQDKNSRQKIINTVRPQDKEVPDVYYLLNKIGQLWLYGLKIDGPEFYAQEKRHRIPLPTYPFEGQPYDLEVDFTAGVLKKLPLKSPPGEKIDKPGWFYIPSWERSLSLPPPQKNHDLLKQYHWLVFLDEDGIGLLLVERLKQAGHQVTTVTTGVEFKKITQSKYEINPKKPNDYETLFTQLSRLNGTPRRIVHLWGSSGKKNIRMNTLQDLGFYSLLYMAKAMTGKDSEGVVEITIVTSNMQEVTGEENLCPGKSTVLGPVMVVPQEHPRLFCRSIDILVPKPGSSREKRLVDQLEAELREKSPARLIAFRGNHRWVRVFKSIPPHTTPESALPLKKQGVYLITGGLGKIALIIAEYLAQRYQARLILTGRSAFPARDRWEHWLVNHDEEDPVSKKIKNVQKLESLGAKVMVFSADAANQVRMKTVIAEGEERFGRINGIIHAAGLVGGDTSQLIEKLGKTECQEHFQAKIYGLVALGNLFREKEPDFCWLTSSIAAVLGGLRSAAYAAANTFMDAFVNKHNQSGRGIWLSVNWDGIHEEDKEKIPVGFQRTLALVGGPLNQVVISLEGNLQDRFDQWIKLESLRDENDSNRETSPSLYPRPNMSNPYTAPRSKVEQEISHIMHKLFGFEPIGIRDDFFELGGDSLKAITAISRIHRMLHVEIPLTEFFKRPTIEQLAEYISKVEKSVQLSIEPVEKKEYYMLSPAQERLYSLQKTDVNCIAYNEPIFSQMAEAPDKKKLKNTFKKLIRRHESLRTSFHILGDRPVQKIHQQVEFEIEYFDISKAEVKVKEEMVPFGQVNAFGGQYPKSQEQRAKSCIYSFIRPFDLSAAVIRVGLIKMPAGSCILMVDLHHIAADAISQDVLTEDFIALYHESELPALRLQFKDFSSWQNRLLQSGHIHQQEQYWLKELETEIPADHFPTDYPKPVVRSYEGSSIRFEIAGKETGALKKIARQENATLYMVLLALYNILAAKISGKEDVIIGSVTAGRRHEDLEKIIGVFVNTIILRNYPHETGTFTRFLADVKERTIAAFENQDCPMEQLVEKASAIRDIIHLGFAFQNIEAQHIPPPPKKSSPPINIKPYHYENKTSKGDLTLRGEEIGKRLLLVFEYSMQRFKKETIARYIKYFHEIVSTVTENPHIQLQDISLTHDLLEPQSNILREDQGDFEF